MLVFIFIATLISVTLNIITLLIIFKIRKEKND